MICLGRSNYFRFNHPSDAHFMRSILPDVRLSMAPIPFYPAVDNPEYFHMSPQEAGLGESPTVTETSSNELEQNDNDRRPVIPPRKTVTKIVNNNDEEIGKTLNHVSNSIRTSRNDRSNLEGNDSDSDEPPEIPPRSEAPFSSYVNSSSFAPSDNNSCGLMGDYLYPKGDYVASSLSRVSRGTARVVPGAATVVAFNGTTSVHNALYRSFPATTNLPLPQTLAPPIPHSCHNGNPPTSYFRSNSLGTGVAVPQGHAVDIPSRSRLRASLEDLRSSELKKQRATELRLEEEEAAAVERSRLDEILAMCAEYEKQQQLGETNFNNGSHSPNKNQHSSYSSLSQNRIKTNGSLPREKRQISPLSSPPPQLNFSSTSATGYPLSPSTPNNIRAVTPSEDELGAIFNFDGEFSKNSLTRKGSLTHPSPTAQSPNLLNNPSPPTTPRSPYENVSPPYHHSYVPQSPRTRIRTTVGKEKHGCEVFENKFATLSDFSSIPSKDRHVPTTRGGSLSPERPFARDCASPNASSPIPPPKPPRSPRIERGILNTYTISNDPNGIKGNINHASVIDNKSFIPVTPKCKISDPFSPGQNRSNVSETSHIKSNSINNTSSLDQKDSVNSSANSDYSYYDSKIKNKVFEEQMLKNIQDTLNINDVTGEIERLNNEKSQIIEITAKLKNKITEIERQENESLRELEMERALVDGELASTKLHLSEEEKKLAVFMAQSADMDERHEEERRIDQGTIQHCKNRLEKAEDDLEETETKHEGFTGTTDEETEMLEILKSQHESVEAERKFFLYYIRWKRAKKIFEDTEFSQMESEAHRESEREELNKEISEMNERILKHKQKISELEEQMSEMTSSVCQEAEMMENQRQDLITRMSKVSASSPLGCDDASLGRKASATLMEIERNRQLLLAKQGAITIDNERRKVEELKRRVAEEVKAKWEERKAKERRELNCASINSIASEDSSMTSSDLHTESLSSDDIIVQRSSGDSGASNFNCKMRQRGGDGSGLGGEDIRPVSDASSCDPDISFVKLRDKPKTQQRPLTRYLPVRAEVPFDLRQHIESAGHQIELCPYLKINSTCCRGYLHKLGSKFRTWQKRWFVFDRMKRTFIYYSDKNEIKPKGGVAFQNIEEVYVDHLHSADSLIFCVKTHERTFQLMARSPEAMRIWIDVIFTGAEGYREFQGGT